MMRVSNPPGSKWLRQMCGSLLPGFALLQLVRRSRTEIELRSKEHKESPVSELSQVRRKRCPHASIRQPDKHGDTDYAVWTR
jgi:hypothetical protein